MLTNPTLGEGRFDPNEIDADALFARITERTADLVLHGPSLDDERWVELGWFEQMLGDCS